MTSAVSRTVHVNARLAVDLPSETRAVSEKARVLIALYFNVTEAADTLIVPEMTPVAELSDRPLGSDPDNEYVSRFPSASAPARRSETRDNSFDDCVAMEPNVGA